MGGGTCKSIGHFTGMGWGWGKGRMSLLDLWGGVGRGCGEGVEWASPRSLAEPRDDRGGGGWVGSHPHPSHLPSRERGLDTPSPSPSGLGNGLIGGSGNCGEGCDGASPRSLAEPRDDRGVGGGWGNNHVVLLLCGHPPLILRRAQHERPRPWGWLHVMGGSSRGGCSTFRAGFRGEGRVGGGWGVSGRRRCRARS